MKDQEKKHVSGISQKSRCQSMSILLWNEGYCLLFLLIYTYALIRFIRLESDVGDIILPSAETKIKSSTRRLRRLTKKEKEVKLGLYVVEIVVSIGTMVYVYSFPPHHFNGDIQLWLPIILLNYFQYQTIIGENGIVLSDMFWNWSKIQAVEVDRISVYSKYFAEIRSDETCYLVSFYNQKGKKLSQKLIASQEEEKQLRTIFQHKSILIKEILSQN